ncbi:MAG: hypothetical protein HYZ37_00700 [Candidatus Solibacter usitatus]|nr:hypothetical protein [Candidatus Solibacter usitatus]
MRTALLGFGIITSLLAVSCGKHAYLTPAMVQTSPKPMPTAEAADHAQRYFYERRTGGQDLPLEKYEIAREHAARMPVFSFAHNRRLTKTEARAAAADLGGWASLGPSNQGGRTKVLIIHPNNHDIMYAGSTTGGIFKTTDGGQNWAALADLMPSLGIGAMAFHPNDPETLFAGTGFWFSTISGTNVYGSAVRGAGIYKSTDGGATWNKWGNPDPVQFRYVNRIHVSRNNPDRMYAATWSGVWKSVDGGQSWTVSLRPATSTTGCQAMVMRTDVDTDYLFAACGTSPAENPAIYRIKDAAAGNTWEQVHKPAGMANTTLAIAPSNPSIIYALSASFETDKPEWRNGLLAVFRSTANGDAGTWDARVTNQDPVVINKALLSSNASAFVGVCLPGSPSFGSQGWIHNAIAIDPQDPDRVYVAGIDIYRSDDGGANWGIASFWQAADGPQGAHADVLNLVYHPGFDGSGNQTLYVASDGGIYRTKNSRAALATGLNGGCFPYRNEVAWQPLHNGYTTIQFYTGAVYPGGFSYFGGAQDNGTFRGTEGGKGVWTKLNGGDGMAVLLDPINPNNLYLSTQGFGFRRSTNGGRTFTSGTSGVSDAGLAFVTPVAMDPANPQRLWTGGYRFWTSINGAVSWTAASIVNPTAQGSVSFVAVSAADPNRVLFGTSQGYVYRSRAARESDDATVWESSRPRAGFLSGLAFDPTNADIVYATYSQFNAAANQSHVYRSTDGGATWQGIDGSGENGIPDIPVLCIVADPVDGRQLYIGTDIGVFVSTDGGANWMRDAGPFANVVTETLILNRDTGVTRLYAFTFGRGAWRTDLPNTGTPCAYEIDDPEDPPAFGGTFSLNVRTSDGCRWSALPVGTFVDIGSPASGTGSGKLTYTVPLSTATARRRAGIEIQDRSFSVMQGAAVAVRANDEMAGAAAIASLPYVGVVDTRTFTANAGDPQQSCTQARGQKTAWWIITPQESGAMEVMVQAQRYDAFGNSGFVASLFPLNGTTPGAELACFNVVRNTSAWVFGGQVVNVTAGQRYALMVSATGTAANDGGFTVVGVRKQ